MSFTTMPKPIGKLPPEGRRRNLDRVHAPGMSPGQMLVRLISASCPLVKYSGESQRMEYKENEWELPHPVDCLECWQWLLICTLLSHGQTGKNDDQLVSHVQTSLSASNVLVHLKSGVISGQMQHKGHNLPIGFAGTWKLRLRSERSWPTSLLVGRAQKYGNWVWELRIAHIQCVGNPMDYG